MEWDVLEHRYTEKDNDWYATVIVIAGALIAGEFYFNNILMVVLTIIATIAFIVVSARHPNVIHVTIGKTGIRAGSLFYPFSTLDAFSIIDHPLEHKILLESTKAFMPIIVIPIPDEVDREHVRDTLHQFLPEKMLREPTSQMLLEYLGF